MSGAETLTEEWIKKAEEDALSLEAVLKNGAPSTACFLSQQMAEKYLKALLVSLGKEFPKTHNLVTLAALVQLAIPTITELKADLESLTIYAIEPRYPTDLPEVTLPDAQAAAAAAKHVKEFVQTCLASDKV